MKPPQPAGSFVEVSVGEGLADALCRGLRRIDQQIAIQEYAAAPDRSTQLVSSRMFGAVELQAMEQIYGISETVNGKDVLKTQNKLAIEISFQHESRSMLCKLYEEGTGIDDSLKFTSYMEVIGSDASLADIVSELQQHGFRFKVYANLDAYYLLTIYRPN
jgi:hypothetical protein